MSNVTTVVLFLNADPREESELVRRLAEPYPGDNRRQALAFVSAASGGDKMPEGAWMAGLNYLEWEPFKSWVEALPLEEWQREDALLLVQHEIDDWQFWRFAAGRLIEYRLQQIAD